ncbi:MAG: nitrous oxide reductase accessory protein NosL, partial [Bacteroidia bacterium]
MFMFSEAQKAGNCGLCKMDINDTRFLAKAELLSGEIVYFDAAECLINFLKENDTKVKISWVADYNSKKSIDATKAYYLKSKGLPSPMGANLSAYETEEAAKAMKKQKGGEVLDWEALRVKFENSRFGSVEGGHHHHGGRPDMYGPAGVMGDHLHAKGGKMLSLCYMNMGMEGSRSGTELLSDAEVHANHMVSPQDMRMSMYMLGGMWAPSDRVTLMLMQNLVSNKMDLTSKMMMGGMTMVRDFSTSSVGFGDLKASAMIGLWSKYHSSIHLNTGVSVPLGSVERTDETPMKEAAKLPYAMQLGSGTVDANIGATYRGSSGQVSWGLQQLNTLRFGENSQGYNFGNMYQSNVWGAYAINKRFSSSLRVNGSIYEAIDGQDDELSIMMVPTANPANYERQLVRGFIGVNSLLANESILISAEFGAPLYQHTDGIFMNETMSLNACVKLIL